MRIIVTCIYIFLTVCTKAQPGAQDSIKKLYLAELKIAGKKFTNDLYSNYVAIYSLQENAFAVKIDAARNTFGAVLKKYAGGLDKLYVTGQQTEIRYYFDKLLIEYPSNHDIYSGSTTKNHSLIARRLTANLRDFNKFDLLSNSDFTDYVKAYLAYRVTVELEKLTYRKSDNQQLAATWKLLNALISDPRCNTFWRYRYLYDHIDNNGIKDINSYYADFKRTCKDTSMLSKMTALYSEDSTGRAGHPVKKYKSVGGFNLDMHIFFPDTNLNGIKRQVIVFFHGGSWSEGKPDWFFSACENYTKKGWVACAVEYRTYGRHGTLPFEAVKDARSAIRWLRSHAKEYNIDTDRIVASGNSAGGHLVLCAALADKYNEKTDDLKYSPVPDLLLVNSGVYDLTDQNTAWIRKDLKDKNSVKEISPVYLIKKDLPPALLIHGTEDKNVPYNSAEKFVAATKKAGNNTIDFKTLQGAAHFIWYDAKYSSQVSAIRLDFLSKYGY